MLRTMESTLNELRQRYLAGERNFPGLVISKGLMNGELAISEANLDQSFWQDINLNGITCIKNSSLDEAQFLGCWLMSKDLSESSFMGADFQHSVMDYVNMSKCNLRGAHFTNASIFNINLEGALLHWQSNDLIAEILRRAADGNYRWLKIAGLVKLTLEDCGDGFQYADWQPVVLALEKDELDWLKGVLAPWASIDDEAPAFLKGAQQVD